MANAGGWKRISAGYHVYRNAAGNALAYAERYRGKWESEIRQEDGSFAPTKVRVRTLAEAKAETETLYRAQRASAK